MKFDDPDDLLRAALAINTSNPPGDERSCIELFARQLSHPDIIGLVSERPNLIATLKGRGSAPPLLIYAHVDTAPQGEQPNAGTQKDNCIWGRGAIDAKSVAVQAVTSLRRLAESVTKPPGNVILVLTVDEEENSLYGAHYLASIHPELFSGVKHAFSEFGRYTFYAGNKHFYPIQVSERQSTTVTIEFSSKSGHSALPQDANSIAAAARFLNILAKKPLPIELSPISKSTFTTIVNHLTFPNKVVVHGLGHSFTAPLSLKLLRKLGQQQSAAKFESILRSTVQPTIIKGGEKPTISPDKTDMILDARLLPSDSHEKILKHLNLVTAAAKADANIRVQDQSGKPNIDPDLSQIDLISRIFRRHIDFNGIELVTLLPASTDARFFNELGIQTYGILPMMRLPPDVDFLSGIHGKDERIPMGAMDTGANALVDLVKHYNGEETPLSRPLYRRKTKGLTPS